MYFPLLKPRGWGKAPVLPLKANETEVPSLYLADFFFGRAFAGLGRFAPLLCR